MNLYLRLIWLLLKNFLMAKGKALEPVKLTFRAWLLDCDLNGHLTNSRYLSFMDLGRILLIGKMRLFKVIFKKKWFPVLVAAEISFIKPIAPFQKFDLVTRIIAWDDKYYYFEQRFEVNGELYALGLAKGVFIHKREKVPVAKVNELVEEKLPEQLPLPELIKQWKNMTEVKKDSSAN